MTTATRRLCSVAVVLAGALALFGASSVPASAGTCYTPDYTSTYSCPDPRVTAVSVPRAVAQMTSSPVQVPVKVTVDDPSNLADAVELTLRQGGTVVDLGYETQPVAVSGSSKTYAVTFNHYEWDPFGVLTVDVAVDAFGADVKPTASRTLKVLARSVITNTPSSTSVRKGVYFTERGVLRRFDGTPQAGQRVNVYYVPAGQTKASYAGAATTASNGSFSLRVRSWYTGSWFVNFPGSAFTAGAYKGAWVRVG